MNAASLAVESAASVSLTTNKGQALRVDFTLERLVSLRHQTAAALRIEPVISLEYDYDESGQPPLITEHDRALIDEAVFDYAAALLATGRAKPAIVLPISFFTVAARRGRRALAMISPDMPELMKSSVIVEFVDVDRGTPVSRLTEVGGMVNALCRAVFVRVQPAVDMLACVRGYRPHGLTLDASGAGATDAQVAAQILAFGEQAKGAAPLLVVQGLANEGFFQVADVAGASHASVRPGPRPAVQTAA